jgi:hypothetical protein
MNTGLTLGTLKLIAISTEQDEDEAESSKILTHKVLVV